VVQDEGDEISPVATTLNFTGAGVTASLTSPGVVEVNVPGGGSGGVGTLQEVTDLGNSTTNDIAFTASAGLSFDNGAFFRKGTTDAGNGGAKGTSQICSISYELKWEAGRLYYMQQDGFTIRDVTHNFTFVPQVTDDSTKGFVAGSRWSLDDGTVYLCSDATIGAAVWAVVSISVPSLQDVTDVGNTSTNDILILGANDFIGQVSSQSISTSNTVSSAYAEITVTTNGQLTLSDGTSAGILSVNNLTNSNVQLEFPNKATGNYTIATTADIVTQVNSDWNATTGVEEILNKPTIPAAQVNSDWNATSGLAEILNKPTIPVVTGFVPYTGATADLDMGTHNVTADHIALNVSPSGAGFVVGATQWNNTIGSSETLLKGGNVTLKNGVDLVARIVNKVSPNTTLTKAAYQAVRVSGASGQRLAVELARANTDNNSADTIGLVCETIATNQEGFIITVGQLLDINTTGSLQGETWADGDVLYLSPTTAGRLTNIKPTGATGHIVVMGYVEYSHASQGAIYVKVMNGWELDELHNVFISSPANNDALIYESATQLWKNKTIATALGYTPVATTRSIGTTAPLSGGGDLSADRTIAIADAAADGSTKGAAAFTANDFNAASGVISIDYTNGQTASASNKGFLTANDWTTFNGKASMGIYKNTTDGAASSGTANTYSQGVLIPANSVVAGSVIEFKLRGRKTGANAVYTIRLYANTTNNLSGSPVLLATYTATLIQALALQTIRTAAVKNATTNTEMALATTSLATDFANTSFASIAVDWTADKYIVGAVQNSNATDSSLISLISMTII
jgi:hypothetical protein